MHLLSRHLEQRELQKVPWVCLWQLCQCPPCLRLCLRRSPAAERCCFGPALQETRAQQLLRIRMRLRLRLQEMQQLLQWLSCWSENGYLPALRWLSLLQLLLFSPSCAVDPCRA